MIFRGIRTVVTVLVLCAFSLTYIAIPAQAYTTNLSSQDFSKMYYFASKGDAQRLSMAISRGLNINATNINGDTGLCVAVRNQNITAYKTFRAVGANPRPECSWRIPHFDQFVISHQMTNGSYYARQTVFPTAKRGYRNVASTAAEKISTGSNAWYWIGGAALVGGGVALAAGGGGGGGSSGGDSSGDDNNENICNTNPCTEGCYIDISKPGDDYECTKSNSCSGCEEWTCSGISKPENSSDVTCSSQNACGNCNVDWTCPSEKPKPTESGAYRCTDFYDCGETPRCKKWEKVDAFSKEADEDTTNLTISDDANITYDGAGISGTWGGVYVNQIEVTNNGSITLTGGDDATGGVGIMSASTPDLEAARTGEITTTGGNITNNGRISIEANESVGIFATSLGEITDDGSDQQLTSLNTITNSENKTISLTGNNNTGIELVGDAIISNNGEITLEGNGKQTGILHQLIKDNNQGFSVADDIKTSITNDGAISLKGDGELCGIRAGNGVDISGSGDITLNGTNTDDGNPQTMYGIYAGDDAKITYTGNIKNESTGTNVTMIAVQAGDNSEATLGTETPDATEKTQVEGDISLGKGSTLTNVQNTITGNINGGDINNKSDGIITGDINTTGTISNESGSEINIGKERTIIAKKINNFGTIGTSENPFALITVTGDDGAFSNLGDVYGDILAKNDKVLNDVDSNITGNITAKNLTNKGNISGDINITDGLDNSGQITGNIISDTGSVTNQSGGTIEEGELKANSLTNYGIVAADTITAGTITNGSASPAEANIKASTISATNITNNNGTINGKIITETLNNATAGATIKSSELIARNIENCGTINIDNGTLAANIIENTSSVGEGGEENGTINVSAGMSFSPMSDGNGNGADIILTDVLTFTDTNNSDSFENIKTPIINILTTDSEDTLTDGNYHTITLKNIKTSFNSSVENSSNSTDSVIKINASNTKLNLVYNNNDPYVNEIESRINDGGSIIDASDVANNGNSIISIANMVANIYTPNDDSTTYSVTGINAPNSTVEIDNANISFNSHNTIDSDIIGIDSNKLSLPENSKISLNFAPQYIANATPTNSFTGIKTNLWEDAGNGEINIYYAEDEEGNGHNGSVTMIAIEFGENSQEKNINSMINIDKNNENNDDADGVDFVYGIKANNSGSITLSENASINVKTPSKDIEYGAHLIDTDLINKGTISINDNNNSSYAVYMKGGDFENSGSIGNGDSALTKAYALYQDGGSFLNNGDIKGNVTLENITSSTNDKNITGNVSIVNENENEKEKANFVNGNGAILSGNLTLKNVNLINNGTILNTTLDVENGKIDNKESGNITFNTAELLNVTFINRGNIISDYGEDDIYNGHILQLRGFSFTNYGEINLRHYETYQTGTDNTTDNFIGIEAIDSELSLGGAISVGNLYVSNGDDEDSSDSIHNSLDTVIGIKVSNNLNDSTVSEEMVKIGEITQYGTLNVYGKEAVGVLATQTGKHDNEGYFINNGTINVTTIYDGTAYGMQGLIEDQTYGGIVRLVNNGTISLKQPEDTQGDNVGTTSFKGYGMYGDGMDVSLYNLGTIKIQREDETTESTEEPYCKTENGASCSNVSPIATAQAFMLMRGARMYNSGTLSQETDMNFDEMGDGTGEVYFGKTAVFEAPSVSGTAIAMADHTTGSNEDSYTTTGNFVADNVDVNVKSGTAMFMARSSGSGVRMQRIAFTNLLQDKELANYLESNYQSGNRVDLFDDLKQANDNNSLYDAAKRALGHEFFPLLAWQNQQRVRHFNHTMEDLVLDDDTLKSERTVAKFDSNYTEQDAANGLPGYEDKIYGVSGLFDKEVNKNYRFGVGIGLYNAYAEFDDDDTRRDAIVQAYQTNRFDYDNWGALVMPFAGYSRGEYKRYATSGKYEPHFNVWYLGLNNRAYLKQDFGNWRIEPTVELNLSTIYQDKVKENNNITVKGQNSLSVEAGAGAYAKRKYDLGENGALEVKGGAMYYRELNSKAYDDHSAQMYGMDGNYHISGYENDRNRAELSFKADYKIGKWSVYGEVSQSFADNDNTVYNAGIRLAF